MTATADFLERICAGGNLSIPVQRSDRADDLPPKPRSDSCPSWCQGHGEKETAEQPLSHRSREAQVRVGATYPIRTFRLFVRADAEGSVPWVHVDGEPMTAEQARNLAAGIHLAAGLLDPPSDNGQNAIDGVAQVATAYSAAAKLAASGTAGDLAMKLATIALELKGLSEALRFVYEHSEPNYGYQLEHNIHAAVDNLSAAVKDILTAGMPDRTVAELVNLPKLIPSPDGEESARRMAEALSTDASFDTQAGCRPWCWTGTCGGYCMTEPITVLASAGGGKPQDNGVLMPALEIFARICHPLGRPCVAVEMCGPGPFGRDLSGGVEMRPEEALRAADALRHFAQQATTLLGE